MGTTDGHEVNDHSLTRITINLSPRATAALESLIAASGDNKTDVINRAIKIYAYLESVISNDGRIFVRETPKADLAHLRFF